MIEDYDSLIEDTEKKVNKLTLEYTMKKRMKEKLEKELKVKQNKFDKTKDLLDVLEQVRLLLQRTSVYAREQIKQQIEMLVTHCLQFVFGPSIEFEIELRRN